MALEIDCIEASDGYGYNQIKSVRIGKENGTPDS
jgi:hypothetical protein